MFRSAPRQESGVIFPRSLLPAPCLFVDELKVHLLGRKTLIRSLNPGEVVQEIYGWLLGHWAVRSLMLHVGDRAQISPLRLSFTGTLNIIRRAIPKFQRLQPEEIPFFSAGL
ncbi:transposase [Tolypothrix sp. NIES-4075]|nr:transposase [Tolypothrix sp. NIES-4075]